MLANVLTSLLSVILLTFSSSSVSALRISSHNIHGEVFQVSAMESLGFILSTFSATATPEVTATTTVVDIEYVTPTPTLWVDPTAMATFSTTLGVATTMTSTLEEVGPTVTPLPPAPVVSICSPYFYVDSNLYYLKNGSQSENIPFLAGKHCQMANVTSVALAQDIAKELCENVLVEDGLAHHAGFVPYQCPILSPNAVLKSPRNGCHGSVVFDTLCVVNF